MYQDGKKLILDLLYKYSERIYDLRIVLVETFALFLLRCHSKNLFIIFFFLHFADYLNKHNNSRKKKEPAKQLKYGVEYPITSLIY